MGQYVQNHGGKGIEYHGENMGHEWGSMNARTRKVCPCAQGKKKRKLLPELPRQAESNARVQNRW